MSRKSLVMKKEEVKLLVEELEKHAEFKKTDEKDTQLVVILKNLRITVYNPERSESSVFPQGKVYQAFDEAYEKVTGNKIGVEVADHSEATMKSEEPDKSKKVYNKDGEYNEFGADEVGKEFFNPFMACAVYYDDAFNKEEIFKNPFEDPKNFKGDSAPEKIKEVAERLMSPENGLKYVVVAMTDLEDMKPFMRTDKGEELRVDATYKFNEIRKSVNNMNNVQAILINEAIRILVERYPKAKDNINESTFDSFFNNKGSLEAKNAYYDYLKGEAAETFNVHVEKVMQVTHGIKTEIIENVVPTKGADETFNSPTAAAAHIASYYRNVFFDNANDIFEVEDEKGTPLVMPRGDGPRQKIIDYGKRFIKKYGIEKFNHVTKKRRKKDTYYNDIISESLEENLISDEDKSKIRID